MLIVTPYRWQDYFHHDYIEVQMYCKCKDIDYLIRIKDYYYSFILTNDSKNVVNLHIFLYNRIDDMLLFEHKDISKCGTKIRCRFSTLSSMNKAISIIKDSITINGITYKPIIFEQYVTCFCKLLNEIRSEFRRDLVLNNYIIVPEDEKLSELDEYYVSYKDIKPL